MYVLSATQIEDLKPLNPCRCDYTYPAASLLLRLLHRSAPSTAYECSLSASSALCGAGVRLTVALVMESMAILIIMVRIECAEQNEAHTSQTSSPMVCLVYPSVDDTSDVSDFRKLQCTELHRIDNILSVVHHRE